MEKDILERLAESTAKKGSTHAKQNLAIFLALRGQIDLAINSGWPIKDIWQLFYNEKKINISYQVFLRLAKKYTDYESKTRTKKGNELKEKKPLPETKHNSMLEKESGKKQDSMKKTSAPIIYPDTGNPNGFEWSAECDPDDLL